MIKIEDLADSLDPNLPHEQWVEGFNRLNALLEIRSRLVVIEDIYADLADPKATVYDKEIVDLLQELH